MAIRIYALAKELQLDNKDLVDLLPKAGISGKGSALASLGDDEVAKIKDYLSKKSARPADRPAGGAAAPERLERPTTGAPVREIKNLDRPRPLPPARTNRPSTTTSTIPDEEPTAPDAAIEVESASMPSEPETPPTVETAPPSVSAEASPAPSQSPPATKPSLAPRSSPLGSRISRPSAMPPSDTGPLRREDYIAPAGTTRKPIDLSSRRDDVSNPQRKKPGDQQQRPIVRVAPMNLAPVPTIKPVKSNEPAPQKPDMKLPMDVIRQTKTGAAKPLQEHMKNVVQKQTDAAKAKTRTPLSAENSAGGRAGDKKKGGRPGEGGLDSKLGGREARQLIRKGKGGGSGGRMLGNTDETSPQYRRPYRPKIKRTKSGSTAAPRKSKVVLELPCTVREFSEAAGISAAQVLGKLMGLGFTTSITGSLDQETAEMLALEFGVELDLREGFDVEEELYKDAETPDDESTLQPRPPVVTFLGHVDHGKTSLLDKIIGIKVAAGESGGITQHIRAYEIEKEGRKISFVDTPGHEAFTEMRTGANVTDIAVLVVAADDGVMPQTEEAISHARAAGVPIVVALNKSDLQGWDEQKIFQQLATAELLPTAWGGEVEVVKTSASDRRRTGRTAGNALHHRRVVRPTREPRSHGDRHMPGVVDPRGSRRDGQGHRPTRYVETRRRHRLRHRQRRCQSDVRYA
ncbi:MAG: translation initiation factor IF-2 N-terminal domain-containing protein [Pirellulales bacterium]